MEVKMLPVLENQYYKAEVKKNFIFLHHTSGSSAASAVSWWNSKPDRIATPFIIDRDGTIYQTFNPKAWSYALGVKGATNLEKASIHIELVAWGGLTKDFTGRYKSYTNQLIPIGEVRITPGPYRGFSAFHVYTQAQIDSLELLLRDLILRFKVPKSVANEFWEYRNPFNLPFGIWSHTSVRKDKSDIFPQTSLIDMLRAL